MIDLHLHSTASDGLLPPASLVARVAAKGLSVISVTDHDTMAATRLVARAAAEHGIEAVPGIEITAVADGRDVHVLGYFLDPAYARLADFLAGQRADRVRRVSAMARRLDELGYPIDIAPLLARVTTEPDRALGRPELARVLVAAGHVTTVGEAFDRLLGAGQPAFVPRRGATPHEVIALIQEGDGLSSLAHPGLLGLDAMIPGLARAGLTAIEVYHSHHTAEAQARYGLMARQLGLAVTGGSDYHGESTDRLSSLGIVGMPADEYQEFRQRLERVGLVNKTTIGGAGR